MRERERRSNTRCGVVTSTAVFYFIILSFQEFLKQQILEKKRQKEAEKLRREREEREDELKIQREREQIEREYQRERERVRQKAVSMRR